MFLVVHICCILVYKRRPHYPTNTYCFPYRQFEDQQVKLIAWTRCRGDVAKVFTNFKLWTKKLNFFLHMVVDACACVHERTHAWVRVLARAHVCVCACLSERLVQACVKSAYACNIVRACMHARVSLCNREYVHFSMLVRAWVHAHARACTCMRVPTCGVLTSASACAFKFEGACACVLADPTVRPGERAC